MYCPRCGQPVDAGTRFCGVCGLKLDQAGGAVPETSAPPYYSPVQPYPPVQPPMSTGERLAKYVLHGLVYTILGFLLSIILAIMAVILTLCGWIFGLIIALVVIVLSIGYLNTFVDRVIWNDDLQDNLSTVFLHGLLLIIILFLASIPQLVLEGAVGSLTVDIVLFLIYLPINGFLAHWVAGKFTRGSTWMR